tara:strand:+ start:33653 stop:34114 length:462 start_codon:yes stop_codon:yes gene_type:complete
MDRPSWNQYFMGLAHYCSLRSHDHETKVGCVIVDDNNHVVSLGYNGFCSHIDDAELPKTRPEKYPFMVHAEQNAISNLVIKSHLSLSAYITHRPCAVCSKLLWQNNVRKWFVEEDSSVASLCGHDKTILELLICNGLEYTNIKTNFDIFKSIH